MLGNSVKVYPECPDTTPQIPYNSSIILSFLVFCTFPFDFKVLTQADVQILYVYSVKLKVYFVEATFAAEIHLKK